MLASHATRHHGVARRAPQGDIGCGKSGVTDFTFSSLPVDGLNLLEYTEDRKHTRQMPLLLST